MKPKAQNEHEDGLLEYLEDIIGTSSYKAPIEEALAQVEVLTDQRGEKLNRLRIVEREKNALEAQRKEAMDYLRLYNDHVKAQSRLWQWYLWKILESEGKLNTQIVGSALTIFCLPTEDARVQAKYQKELDAETERNKDDIDHLEMLEKHFEGREKAYKVRRLGSSLSPGIFLIRLGSKSRSRRGRQGPNSAREASYWARRTA